MRSRTDSHSITLLLLCALATGACFLEREQVLPVGANSPMAIWQSDTAACALQLGPVGSGERWAIGCGTVSAVQADSTCQRIGAFFVSVWYAPLTQLCAYSGAGELLFHHAGSLQRRTMLGGEFGTLLHFFPCLNAGVSVAGTVASGNAVYRILSFGDSTRVLADLPIPSVAQSSFSDSGLLVALPTRLLVSSTGETSFTVTTSRDSTAVVLQVEQCNDPTPLQPLTVSLAAPKTVVEGLSASTATLVYVRATSEQSVLLLLSAGQLYRVVCSGKAGCTVQQVLEVRGPLVTAYECADHLCEIFATHNNSIGLLRHAIDD